MIISRIYAGLGNQMFQYAAGLALAEKHRTVFKLDVSWFQHHPGLAAHNRYALSCLNITEQFATAEEIDRVRGPVLTKAGRGIRRVVQALGLDDALPRYSRHKRWHHVAWQHYDGRIAELPDNTYLDGLCHSERYFADIANLVRQHFSFRYPLSPEAQTVAEEIRAGESIAVHVRRGDYITNPEAASRLGALDHAYYRRAFSLMRAKFPRAKFHVFSDELDRVAAELTPPGPHQFVRGLGPWRDHEVLRLMSLCEHAIISNSTFAWWGAWLNARPDKVVIAPAPWCANPVSTTPDLLPPDWLRVSRSAD